MNESVQAQGDGARNLSRYLSVMDRISYLSLTAPTFDDLLGGVLDEVLVAFAADRAWFLYPCDPETQTWGLPMERTRPEWPGVHARGDQLPTSPEVAELFRRALNADGALQYGTGTPWPIPPDVAEKYHVQTGMGIALRPRLGSPWLMGLHHCAQPRLHDTDDCRMFASIAWRLSDALSSMLALKDLRSSEGRIRTLLLEKEMILDNATAGIVYVKDRVITSCNRYFGLILGYESGELIGRSTLFLYPTPEAYAAFGERAYTAMGEGRVHSEEIQLRHRDGTLRWVQMTGQAADRRAPHAGSIWYCTDVTERRKAQENLELAAAAFVNMTEGVMVTDTHNRIISVNPAFTAITGYSEAEALGRDPRFLSADRHDRVFWQNMWDAVTRRGSWRGEIWNRRKGGDVYPEWLTISVIRDADGRISRHVGVFSDITEQKSAQERIQHLAHHDALTGLPNRALLIDRLNQALHKAGRSTQQVAVLFLDLDHFKTINDSLGHPVGDGLLCEVADRLRTCVRASDTVARLGGDEFVVVLSELEGLEATARVVAHLTDAIARPMTIEGHLLQVTPSIGVSLFPRDGRDVSSLLKNADNAMYHAKSAGRATYRFFSEEMDARAHERFRIEADLRRALVNDEFVLHYQTQVDALTGRVTGVEALIRWQHPDRGLLSPATFLPVAEDSGLIVPLGDWILKTACQQARAWKDAGHRVRVAVNLSAKQFNQGGLLESVARVLGDLEMPPQCLELELTESLLVEPTEQTLAVLVGLNTMGVRLSVDDFGTGYSSLSYLKRFPLNQIKVDKSFVQGLTVDSSDRAIVEAVVALARALGLATIAEGVETATQADILRQIGCDTLQGYFFCRPAPAADILKHLTAGI